MGVESWALLCRVCIVPVYFSDEHAERPSPDSCKRVRFLPNDPHKNGEHKNGEHKNEDTHTQNVLETWQSVRVEELQNANIVLQEYIKLIEEHIALKKELSTLKNYLGLVHK